ncbi:hypothetical protein MMPV_009751 [Pyropia vietnamensis]
MACTVAVETVIAGHYNDQVRTLLGEGYEAEAPLRATLRQFRDEEMEHKETGLANEAEQAVAYRAMSKIIEGGAARPFFLLYRVSGRAVGGRLAAVIEVDDRGGAGALLRVLAGLGGGPGGVVAGTAEWTGVGSGVRLSLVPRGAPAVAVADPTWEVGEGRDGSAGGVAAVATAEVQAWADLMGVGGGAAGRRTVSWAVAAAGLGAGRVGEGQMGAPEVAARVAIARALVWEPSVLLLEDPTAGLSPFAAQAVTATLRVLARTPPPMNTGNGDLPPLTPPSLILLSATAPPPGVYVLYDDLLLLSAGRAAYAGAAGSAPLAALGEACVACPPGWSAPDFFAAALALRGSWGGAGCGAGGAAGEAGDADALPAAPGGRDGVGHHPSRAAARLLHLAEIAEAAGLPPLGEPNPAEAAADAAAAEEWGAAGDGDEDGGREAGGGVGGPRSTSGFSLPPSPPPSTVTTLPTGGSGGPAGAAGSPTNGGSASPPSHPPLVSAPPSATVDALLFTASWVAAAAGASIGLAATRADLAAATAAATVAATATLSAPPTRGRRYAAGAHLGAASGVRLAATAFLAAAAALPAVGLGLMNTAAFPGGARPLAASAAGAVAAAVVAAAPPGTRRGEAATVVVAALVGATGLAVGGYPLPVAAVPVWLRWARWVAVPGLALRATTADVYATEVLQRELLTREANPCTSVGFSVRVVACNLA